MPRRRQPDPQPLIACMVCEHPTRDYHTSIVTGHTTKGICNGFVFVCAACLDKGKVSVPWERVFPGMEPAKEEIANAHHS